MKTEQKLVSVIIPTYNCRAYILEAIESVTQQTYGAHEIIVVDDGSVDNTRKVLKELIDTNAIRYVFQENRGAGPARNTGIRMAQGEYIAFLDADDLWEKEKLERSIAFMEEHSFDWVCTASRKVDMAGNLMYERTMPKDAYGYNEATHELYDLRKGVFSFKLMLPVHNQTLVISRECFRKAGLFDNSVLICEDTDLCIRFIDAGLRGGFLNEMLTTYRYRPSSVTKNRSVDGLWQHRRVAKKHALIAGLERQEIRRDYANILWEIAGAYWKDRRFFRSAVCAAESMFYHPSAGRLLKVKKYLMRTAAVQ